MATLNIKHFDDNLYDKLKARAARERRSVAQEVAHILARALDEPAPTSLLDLEGLGREHWDGIDAGRHVAHERDAWG